ncbi:glycosyltransferase family 17 protein [Lophiostoma macrostomum CBS 122681]|uniref:Glycosyltransferase family 17 protein n=1 Tax=Lophiostoma macrostomum CBS 122681 TaxID=1314788 RepID=A0A6A6SLG1_9PLEO|nr:glycosyltransferase family 17 protein [Lophiostoma macrostomum CBS 122681]
MFPQSNIGTVKRFSKIAAATTFVLIVVFYAIPILPLPLIPSYDTTIKPNDIPLPSKERMLEPSERDALCYSHGIPAYHQSWQTKHTSQIHDRRKVYDLFMLNTELDWLEIRLHELAPQVDYFIILESPTTFTGLPKQMYYQDNKHMFQEYEDKIIHHVLAPPPEGHPGHVDASSFVPGSPEYEEHAWTMERFQRNAMFSQVLPLLTNDSAPNHNDVIIVSDIDEMPRPATVQLLRECHFGRMTTLRSRFYYYSFQWLHRGQEWAHPQATTYHGANDTILPHSLRELDGSAVGVSDSEQQTIWNAAWHCSSCFATLAEMLGKMESFSHTNLNAGRFRNKERIVARVRQGKDLWDRWFQWYKRVDDNKDLPEYLKQAAKKGRFMYMVDRDGENAGFEDYTQGGR